MGTNSLATGMDAAPADVALEIARLPDLTPELLTLFEEALLFVSSRDGAVSMQTAQAEVGDCLMAERLETLFFALNQARALTHLQRDRRGHAFDQYRVEPGRLHRTIHDATVARHVLQQVQAEQAGQVELVATLPDSLPLDIQSRQDILPLAAVLHRLITEAEQEVLILNPFVTAQPFIRFF
jgi:hypothetical protein